MAKKKIAVKTIAPAKKVGAKKMSMQDDIKVLENALDNKPVVENVVPPVEEIKPVEETIPPVEEIVPPVENVVPPVEEIVPPVENIIIPEKKKLSLWDDIKKPTEEDANIKDKLSATENVISSLAEDATEIDNYTEEQAKRQSYKVKAGMVVEILDVIFMIICCVITWEFSDENQKKFTLNKDRKKAIQFNLFQLYELQGKKVDPKKAIWGLILGSYVPMLIIALLIMFGKMKAAKAAKDAKKVAEDLNDQGALKVQEMQNQLDALQADRERLQIKLSNSLNSERKAPIVNGKAKKRTHPVFIHTEDTVPKKGRGRPKKIQ